MSPTEPTNGSTGHEEALLPWLLAYDHARAAGLSAEQARNGTAHGSQDQLESYCSLLDLLRDVWPGELNNRDALESEESVPAQIGRFQIVRELGRGGCGVVYLARDPKLGRRVALKLPRAEVLLASQSRKRFLREAQATAALDHPHIMPLFETGEIGSICYLVSPYCAGGTLGDFLPKLDQALPVRQAALVCQCVAEAVDYAHSRGVLHRDIKPANVLLEPRSDHAARTANQLPFVPRLTDFGLARFLDLDYPSESDVPGVLSTSQDASVTGNGALLGTPNYMAPEQVEGRPGAIGPHTDVYGLGGLLYELLTGSPPFAGGSKVDALRRVLTEEPVPPRRLRPEIPADLEAICLRCLEKQPCRRYASASEVCADLRRFLNGEPTVARPLNGFERSARWARRRPAVASVLGISLLTVAGVIAGLSAHNARLGAYAAALKASLERESKHAYEANDQRRLAEQREQEIRAHAYVSDTWRAWRMWKEGDGHRICELLQASRPRDGQADLRGFEWRYLWSMGCNVTDLSGHLGNVHAACFSPDGKKFASWSSDENDRTVRVWSINERLLLQKIVPVGAPRRAVFSADGRALSVADDKGNLDVWDVQDRQKVLTRYRSELKVSNDFPPELIFSRDGSLLAYSTAVSGRGADLQVAVRVWDPRTDRVFTLVDSAPQRVSAFAFSADARLLAVAWDAPLSTRPMQVFRVATGDLVASLTGGEQGINDLEFSPDGSMLAAGTHTGPGTIHLWNLVTGQHETIEAGGSDTRVYLGWSPDGSMVAGGRDDAPGSAAMDTVRLWNPFTQALVAEAKTAGERVYSVSFSPDGGLLALSGSNALLRLWNRYPREEVQTISAHTSEAWCVAHSPDGNLLVSTSDDHTVKIWDCRTGAIRAVLQRHQSLVAAAAFADDGQTLATSSFDGTVLIWDADGGSLRHTLGAHAGPVRSIAFHSDGRLLASVGDDHAVRLWEVDSGRLLGTLEGHRNKIRAAVFHPGTDLLVTGDNDGVVRVWDTKCHLLRQSWQRAREVQSLATTPDGSLLAVGSKEGMIRLYSMPEGQLSRVLPGPRHGARSLAFSRDGRTLASGGEDAAVTLWHVATGQELLTLPGVNSQVNCLAFSPDDLTLTAATHDGAVVMWNAAPPD